MIVSHLYIAPTANPCPAWCTYRHPGHGYETETDDGRGLRYHIVDVGELRIDPVPGRVDIRAEAVAVWIGTEETADAAGADVQTSPLAVYIMPTADLLGMTAEHARRLAQLLLDAAHLADFPDEAGQRS